MASDYKDLACDYIHSRVKKAQSSQGGAFVDQSANSVGGKNGIKMEKMTIKERHLSGNPHSEKKDKAEDKGKMSY